MGRLTKSARGLLGCLAYAALLGTAAPVQAKWLTIHNDFTMYDMDGKAILTRSGCLRKFGNTFYWYGSANRFTDQTCYSSTDLVHWTNKGVVLQAPSTNRMDVIYNDSTKQYVMFLKTGPSDGCQLGIATSSTPDGKFTLQGNSKVHGSNIGDMAVWQDDDGKAYLTYVWDSIPGANSGGISQHAVAVLSPDYLSVGKRQWLWNAGNREAPMMTKRHGLYYYFTSLTLWTESTETQYYTASSIGGPWTTRLVPMLTPGSPKKNSWDTQCDFVFTFKGPRDTVHMFAGDRWEKPDPARLGDYAWLPMSFTAKDSALVNYYQDWEVDPDAGLWRALDPKRNLALRKTAAASSSTGSNSPANVTDSVGWKNYLNTKWMSSASDSQWIRVDLGSPMSVNRVILKWDSSYAKAFKIQVSTDTSSWTDVYGATKAGLRSVTDETFPTTTARYVRMLGTERGTTGGLSLYDFMVLNDTGVTTGARSRAGKTALASGARLIREKGSIRYSLAAAGSVRLEIVDGRGRLKSVIVDGFRNAGDHEAVLPGALGSGSYILRLTQGGKRLGTLHVSL
jgi:F5/8 type C domain-containing protein/glycosyl hydrolase family 43